MTTELKKRQKQLRMAILSLPFFQDTDDYEISIAYLNGDDSLRSEASEEGYGLQHYAIESAGETYDAVESLREMARHYSGQALMLLAMETIATDRTLGLVELNVTVARDLVTLLAKYGD
jgi:hypothetical protein